MKNIILIIFTLIIGVAEAWGQTALPTTLNGSGNIVLAGGTIYTVTPTSGDTVTINGTLVVPTTGGPVTIYIPAGITLKIKGSSGTSGGSGLAPTSSGPQNGGTGGTGAKPAISVPNGATLIITGEGTLDVQGGDAGAGGSGGNGQAGQSGVNNYGGAGGSGGGGGGGAAAAIGGYGGSGGNGGKGGKAGENKYGVLGEGNGGPGDSGVITGIAGYDMGNVYIIGNVTVITHEYTPKALHGTNGQNGASDTGTTLYYFGGRGGNGGFSGSVPYQIGGGGYGGYGGNGGDGGNIRKQSSNPTQDDNQAQSYDNTKTGDNGNLYIQNTTSNQPALESNAYDPTHKSEITTNAQMPSAIATTFTIDGESSPLRAIYYGTVIEDMDLTTAEKTRTGYTFNGYKIKGTSTQVYDASGTFVYPITTIASSTNSSLNVSLNAPDNITLEADWIPNTYTVTLDNQSGTGGTSSVTATYDSAMPSATAPTRTGYTFHGYFTEANGEGTKYYNADMSSAHIWDKANNTTTLYAHWTANSYTVTLDANGGTGGTTSVSATYDSAMPSATAPTKANYTFMGYFTAENGAGTQYYYPDMSSKRVWDDDTGLINTLYAYWADCHTDKTIKVNYDSNGGYGTMEPQLVRLADNVRDNIFTKRDATSHKQNQFLEWNTKADGTGRGYQPGDVIFATEEYSEITLYAQWDPTFNDIYVIATADDLLDFATMVNSGSTSIKGILATDIDMSGKTWTPIGTYSMPFQGIFNGNGYIVSNLTMADNDDYDQAGLIGYAKNATIKNVIVKNVTLYAKYSMAAACGRIDADASSTTAFLTRCGSYGTFNYTFRPTTPSYNAIGGLAIADKTYFMKNDPDPIRNTYISHVWSTFPKPYYVLESCTANNRIEGTVNYRSSQASCENGGLCYTMNDKTNGSTSWTQTIGVDECPRPTNRGRAVYKEGEDGIDYVPGDILYNIYNVYFISNGGTSTACSDTQVKRYSDGTNNGLSLPTTTREGYTFQGWYTEMEGGTPVSEALSSISADLILYAHWTINDYTLTYDVNGGNALSTDHKEVTYNTAYGELPTPTRTGYTFGGWYTQAIGGDAVSSETIMGAADVTIHAHWTANTYTVTLDKQNGSGGTASVNATYDSAMPSAEAPTRTGYTFGGYYSEPNGGGTQYYDADMSSTHNWNITTNPSTLYAKWTVKQYTVNLDKQGVTGGTSSVTATFDSAMPSATAPSRTGYTFKGYYSEQNGGGTQYYAEDMNSAHNWDIDTNPSTLYAKWEANKCTINLDKQGGSGGTAYVTGTYDSAMPSATAPSRTGYTFAGYYTSPNGGGTQYYDENMVSVSYWNITTNPSTLYANWTANTYTLNFDVQNGDALSPSTQSVTYDAAYGTLPTPTRYGFAFKGWYTTPNGGSETDTEVLTSDIYSIDGDQTIYAHWNTIVVDIDAYSAETQLTGNYFRTFYDSQIAHILPTGVKAYKGKIEGNNLVLTAIEAKDDDDNDIIPKNVPVILRMMPNEEAGVPIPGDLYQIKTKQIPLTTSESELTIDNTDNELIGSDIVIATAVANSYILSFGSNGLGFYEWSTHPLEAHKAYVIKDSANPAKALTFRFEDDVTGINDAITDFMFNDSNMAIYNLNGIRLSKPQKGLNIINGRKVWVK